MMKRIRIKKKIKTQTNKKSYDIYVSIEIFYTEKKGGMQILHPPKLHQKNIYSITLQSLKYYIWDVVHGLILVFSKIYFKETFYNLISLLIKPWKGFWVTFLIDAL